jgi:hypothetical protein
MIVINPVLFRGSCNSNALCLVPLLEIGLLNYGYDSIVNIIKLPLSKNISFQYIS